MTSKYTRNLGLALATLIWMALTVWVISTDLVASGAASAHRWQPRSHLRATGETSAEEPPSSRGLWERLSTSARALWRGKTANPALDAVHEAMKPLGVPDWHRAGYRGKGIKIAILDSGFKGYRQALGKVLPASVLTRSFRRDGRLEARDSQHGILCSEVIHHLAPEAELLFANWEPETPESFLDALRWARRQGAQVISCSIIMPSWSDGEGGGSIHAAMREALGPGDQPGDGLFFASAGNTAQRHWGGTFQPARDGWHQWARNKTDNLIRPYERDRVSVELTSDDRTAYEIVIHDTATGREIDRGRSYRLGSGYSAAVVRFEPQSGRRYGLRVRSANAPEEKGKTAGSFHLTVLGGRLQYARQQGSIPFPGDGAEVVTVSAVDAKGRRQHYSSCGPLRLASKPDLAAVVPFPSVWRPEQPFAGTSAAAPQAAGLAALVWSRHPDWTAAQVRRALTEATRLKKAGHCVEVGHGVAALPR